MVYPSVTWLKVTYSGKTGYVLSHYVVTAGNPAYKAGTVTSASLNVRKTASASATCLGALSKNQTTVVEAPVKAGGKTWYKIRYSGGYGYVDAGYMRKQGS
jgi:uncharacterized protein YgiM (DUF1202 family)